MIALDVGLRSVLIADSGVGGVAALAPGGWFQLDAPQGTTPPYGVFQEASDTPGYAFGNILSHDHLFYVLRAFAVDANEDGPTTVGKIADRLKVLLTNPNLTVSGQTVLSARFDRSFPPLKEWDDPNNRWIYSRGVLVEIWMA